MPTEEWRNPDTDKVPMVYVGHPTEDPGDGRPRCDTCGKYVWPVIHSCKGIWVGQPREPAPVVVDLVRAIRDRLAERAHEEWCNRVHGNGAPCDCPYGDAPAALLAVVDRHHPDPNALWMCVVCGFEGQNIDCTFPCDELRGIAAALGCGEQQT